MTNETTLAITGNLTDAPELRHTQSGAAVVNFTVASTERLFDRESGQWRDGDAIFLRCSAWRDPAERIASSLVKGARVVAVGRLKQRSYEDREGVSRTVMELEVDDIGVSLRYASPTPAQPDSNATF